MVTQGQGPGQEHLAQVGRNRQSPRAWEYSVNAGRHQDRRGAGTPISETGWLKPRAASRVIRTLWRLRPSLRTESRRHGRCCSRNSMGEGSSSTRTPRAGKARSWRPIPRPLCCLLEVARAAGSDRGPGGAGSRRGGRRLFRHPAAQLPPRRLGVRSIPPAIGPRGIGATARRPRNGIPGGGCAAPAALAGVSSGAASL